MLLVLYMRKTSPACTAVTTAMTSFAHSAQRIFTKPAEKEVMAPSSVEAASAPPL